MNDGMKEPTPIYFSTVDERNSLTPDSAVGSVEQRSAQALHSEANGPLPLSRQSRSAHRGNSWKQSAAASQVPKQDLETIRFYVFAVPGLHRARSRASISTAESGSKVNRALVA
jgi:hypothetical protein